MDRHRPAVRPCLTVCDVVDWVILDPVDEGLGRRQPQRLPPFPAGTSEAKARDVAAQYAGKFIERVFPKAPRAPKPVSRHAMVADYINAVFARSNRSVQSIGKSPEMTKPARLMRVPFASPTGSAGLGPLSSWGSMVELFPEISICEVA
jgi:hypothetical protein